uniref:ribosomal protein S10 n=1 Tax=Pseudo-nitzschia multistriata TaxID=183589 RepID=UPI001D10FD5C|nr:ribosomal protein S10 [Pseudo-nitzschia multistriata]UBA15324.1 ribosomal protein S10 [Pseudo-nitzschia multistriata]
MNNKTNEKVRIRLESFNHELLVSSCRKITQTLNSASLDSVGMVTLPTSKRIYCVLRSPHVDKDSREHFEIRTHKRVLEISSDLSVVDLLAEMELDSGVFCSISIS